MSNLIATFAPSTTQTTHSILGLPDHDIPSLISCIFSAALVGLMQMDLFSSSFIFPCPGPANDTFATSDPVLHLLLLLSSCYCPCHAFHPYRFLILFRGIPAWAATICEQSPRYHLLRHSM